MTPPFSKARKFSMCALLLMGMAAATPSLAQLTPSSSKDQVIEYVHQGIAYMQAQGIERAFAEFNNTASPFNSKSTINPVGDLYMLVYKRDGFEPVHGKNPKIQGRNVLNMRDANGVFLIQNMINICWSKEGKGWTRYVWPHSVTLNNATKQTYVERFGDYCVGSGIYQ